MHPQLRQTTLLTELTAKPCKHWDLLQELNLKKVRKTLGRKKKFTTFAPATTATYFERLKHETDLKRIIYSLYRSDEKPLKKHRKKSLKKAWK